MRFILDGEIVVLPEVEPTATLLDHLRYTMRRTGTKEGCAEGDCGACTVLVGERDDHRPAVAWRAVNACILFLPMLDGKALMTIESLSARRELNPLQAVMAANGSSQCGFCTPGFVMSLYARCIGGSGHQLPVADVVAGNLCRCTGYGPILAAAAAVDRLAQDDSAVLAVLDAWSKENDDAARQELDPILPRGPDESQWFAPRTPEALARLLLDHPDARIVAGATDVGLWVTKGLRSIETLIFVGDIPALRRIDEDADGVRLGAAVRFAEAHAVFERLHPDLGELTRRFAGLQIRNAATIGGNIANGSPIGDGAPALIALGAELTLRSATGRRSIALEDYFIAYGSQDRRPGEFVESIWIPRPGPGNLVHLSKLSRRFDSDISAVSGAFRLTVRDGRTVAAKIAFGGMAATPRRAPACEAALVGAPFTAAAIDVAAAALATDYAPISDVRGSAGYRLEVAANLLRRAWHAAQGEPVSVLALDALPGPDLG